MSKQERLLRRAYAAFNARDIDAAIALMCPDVDWPNMMEGGRKRGHDAVRGYWERQFRLIDPRVEPRRFRADDEGRIVVDVRQMISDRKGKPLIHQEVQHVYTFRRGLIERMDVRGG